MSEKVHVLKPSESAVEYDLKQRARQIGTLAGRIVALLRQARAGELRQAAIRRSQEWRRQAEDRYQQVRQRARDVVHDYPVHVVAVAGVAGFIIGAALRIRRTHRAL